MSTRARQLLLEILLLAERYSDREIDWAARELAQSPRGSEIGRLLHVHVSREADRSGVLEEVRIARNDEDNEVTPKAVAASFVAQLGKAKSSRDKKRVEGIARRLRIVVDGKSLDEQIKAISMSLDNLDEGELKSFLGNYKMPSSADHGYVGLANYLIRPAQGE